MINTIKELLGHTLINVEVNSDGNEILFTREDGIRYRMYHRQDCCEDVAIEDVCGDWHDLIGSPLLEAEEATSDDMLNWLEHITWTFYKFATIKGSVTIRWHGISNGYYSQRVDFECLDEVEC